MKKIIINKINSIKRVFELLKNTHNSKIVDTVSKFLPKKSLILSIAIVILLVWNIKQCSEPTKTKTITVEVPAKKGSFELDEKILHLPVKRKDSIIYKTQFKDSIIYIENKVNDKLAEDYQALKSEFVRYKLFLEAIKIQNYSKTFEDDYFTATVTGEVQGELKSMAFDYTIKSRSIETDIEVRNYRFVIGPQVGVAYTADGFTPYLGVGLTYRLIRF
jgi:hypothetical protein